MLRRVAAAGSCLLLAACVVQPARPYYRGGGYPPAYGPPPYPPAAYPPAPYPSPPDTRPRHDLAPNPPGYTSSGYPAPGPETQAGPPGADTNFAEESTDYGTPTTTTLRLADFDAPTPTRIEGAKTVATGALQRMLASDRPPLLVDVIGGQQSVSLPGAIWLPQAGVGRHIDDDIQAWFDYTLSKHTGGDKNRPLVVFCASRMCWLAHNAVLRAVDLGYTDVYWYRGGRDSWQAAGLPMAQVAPPPP